MTRGCFIVLMVALLMPLFNASGQTTSGSSSNTCILCHVDQDEARIADPVDLWRGSVHRAAGIACQDCHGGSATSMVKEIAHDPEAGYVGPPEPEEIHNVCGTCHQLQRENFIASPHGAEGGFWPTCSDCHSNHRVVSPRVTEIAIPDNCSDCHEDETLNEFIVVVTRALVPISNAREEVDALRSTGVPLDQIVRQIDLVKNEYSNDASHLFTLDIVTPQVDGLQEKLNLINRNIRTIKDEVGTRHRFGILLAVLLVMMAGIVWIYRKSLPDE